MNPLALEIPGPLIEALLTPDQALNKVLSLGDSASTAHQKLSLERAALITELKASSSLMENLSNPSSDMESQLESLCDLVLASSNMTESASNFSGWFRIYQKFSAGFAASSAAPMVETAMFLAARNTGDQHYLRMLDTHDELHSTLQAYQLQNRLLGKTKPLANRIVQEVISASGGVDGPFKHIDWMAVESALEGFFDQWVTQPARLELTAAIVLLLAFLRHVVAKLNLPTALWELLLMRMDVELSKLSPRRHHSFVTDVVQPLIAGVGQFGVIGHVIQSAVSRQPLQRQVAELMAVQAVLDFNPEGRLAEQWGQKLNIAALKAVGLHASMVDDLSRELIDAMRQHRERYELDVISAAAAKITFWVQAVEAADVMGESTRATTESMAAQLIEGAADTQGQIRVAGQLQAILRVCVFATAVQPDPTKARALLRRAVALQLNTVRDLQVWKRHREIAARISQLEINRPGLEPHWGALAALAPEIDRALSDQLRVQRVWLSFSENSGTTSIVNRSAHAEMQFLLARYAMFRRLSGEAKAIESMNHWYCAYLFSFPARVDWKRTWRDLRDTLATGRIAIGCEDTATGLKEWVDQMHRCAAARHLSLELEKIAESTISYGEARYSQRVAQGSAPVPPGGVASAWSLGRKDCAWTLGRLSYAVCAGHHRAREQLWFWWQIGVGKNISRVPEPFVKAYLQSLSESLSEQCTTEEAEWVFTQIFDCYQRMFGLKSKDGNAELELFAPILVYGPVWQQELAAAPTVSAFAPYVESLINCCPVALKKFGTELLLGLEAASDEEVYWQQNMPAMLSLMETLGFDAAWNGWLAWQIMAEETLPLGVAALWHGFMQRGHQVQQQLAYGYFLAKNAPALAENLSVYCTEELNEVGLKIPPDDLLKKLIAQIGVTLMSESSTLAALNLARLCMWVRTRGLNRSREAWRNMWLALDASAAELCTPLAGAAATRWNLQMMICCDKLVRLDPVSWGLFSAEDLVLAETQNEELRWRSLLSALVAASCLPDYCPVNGRAVTCRLLLSAEVFKDETTASWIARGQALMGLCGDSASVSFKSRLSERVAQLGTLLYERSRFQELPSINSGHRYVVLMAGLPSARMQWRNTLLARYVDERKVAFSAEDVFVGNLLRESPPDAALAAQVRTALAAGLRYRSPEVLVRKKLLGNQKIPLTPIQRFTLTLVLRSNACHDFLPSHDLLSDLREAVALFSEPSVADAEQLFEVWMENIAETNALATTRQQALRGDIGDMLVSNMVDTTKQKTPSTGTDDSGNTHPGYGLTTVLGHSVLSSSRRLKRASVAYLLGTINHSLQRPTGLNAWTFLSEDVLTTEWGEAYPVLDHWVSTAQKRKSNFPCKDLLEWGQNIDSVKQAAVR